LKAIRVREFGPPEVMQLEEVPDLKAGPKQVVVRVQAAGVNPVDTYLRSGRYPRKPTLPYTPGLDAAGTVESVGEHVVSVSVGTRVHISGTITGAYAEQTLCRESDVHPLPQHMSYSEGASNSTYATAYRALFHFARATPGETVLIHGATGGTGIAAVQLARAAGLKVIGTGGTAKGREMSIQQGAHHMLDHGTPDYLDHLLTITGGHGVDILLEMLANVNLDRDLRVLAPRGRVVVVGSRGRIEIDPRDLMNRDATILGMLLYNTPEDEAAVIQSALAAGFENRTLRPVVRMEIPLAEAQSAHHKVMEPGACGKIILTP
jgi:NADPH2:quinone reductase